MENKETFEPYHELLQRERKERRTQKIDKLGIVKYNILLEYDEEGKLFDVNGKLHDIEEEVDADTLLRILQLREAVRTRKWVAFIGIVIIITIIVSIIIGVNTYNQLSSFNLK